MVAAADTGDTIRGEWAWGRMGEWANGRWALRHRSLPFRPFAASPIRPFALATLHAR